jgi:hypothetical protein
MSTLVLERPQHVGGVFERDRGRPVADTPLSDRTERYGRLTLDDLITGVWEGLAVRGSAGCPACSGTMKPRSVTRGGACEGACGDCGARLS